MPAPAVTNSSHFEVSNWKPFPKNTLRGFLSLTTPSGLVIHNITLHERGDARWIGMPARSFMKDGATTWSPIIEFATKEAREKFQAAALAAFDAFSQEGR